MDRLSDVIRSERIVAGGLLVLWVILIPAVAVAGGFGLPNGVFEGTLEQRLRTIADHASAWRAVNGGFLVWLALSSLGLAAVARQLRASELGHIADLALVAYVIAALLFIVDLTLRLSAVLAAAEETVLTGAVPTWIAPLEMWGNGLFIVYATLTNVALLGFGVALLRTDLVPRWAGWSAVGMSVLVLALLVITGSNIPGMHLIAPTLIGVALLLPRT